MSDDTYRLECPQCGSAFRGDSLAKIAKRGAWHWNSEHGDDLQYSYERIDVVERGGDRIHENIYQMERIPIYVTAFDMMERIGLGDGMLVIGEDSTVCEECLRTLSHDDQRVLLEERHFTNDRWRCQDCDDQIETDRKREQNEDLTSFATDGGWNSRDIETSSNQAMQEYIAQNEPVSLSELESVFGDAAADEALRLVDKNRVAINATWEYTAIHSSVTTDTKQPFQEWLTGKLEEARVTYKDGERTDKNARQKDIALGRLRAFRDARTAYLNRQVNAGVSQEGRR